MLQAKIEYIGNIRNDGFNWALRCYGNKNWYAHNGVPSLYRDLADAMEAKEAFLS